MDKDSIKVHLRRDSINDRVITTKEVTYWEEDENPDYLLPSNGGYNPKQKKIVE